MQHKYKKVLSTDTTTGLAWRCLRLC